MTLTHNKQTGTRIFLSYKQPSPTSNKTRTVSTEITDLSIGAVTALIQYLDYLNIDFEYIHKPINTRVVNSIQLDTINEDSISDLFNDSDTDLVRMRKLI